MLYQWEMSGTSLDEVLPAYELIGHRPLDDEGTQLARDLVYGTAAHLREIDPLIEQQAEHWRLERLATVDRLILRLAAYELLYTPSTPRRVVINEALELARTFSSEQAVKFINGVIDGISRRLAGSRETTL